MTGHRKYRGRRPVPQVPGYPDALLLPPAPVPFTFREPPRAHVEVLQAKNASVAKVTVQRTTDYSKGPDYVFEAAESTKREQGDRYDQMTGELLAVGRALQRAGRDMVHAGNRRVQDLVAEQEESRRRSAERAEAKVRPVKRRTREEWEAMQRNQRHEHKAQVFREVYGAEKLAQGLGLVVEGELGGSVIARTRAAGTDDSAGTRITLSGNRYMEVEDHRVVIRSDHGDVLMVLDRS